MKFDTGGGSKVPSQTVQKNKKAKKPADPKWSNHTFCGWYANKALTKKFDFNKAITANTTVYAKWKAKPITKPSGTLFVKMTSKGKKTLKISWSKVDGAKGYDIFFARCNHGKKTVKVKKVKSFKGNDVFKWSKSGLKKHTAYKAAVKAYTLKDGKKQYIVTSPGVHAYTSGSKKIYTNAKSVKVNKTEVSLTKGKTFKVKAKVKKLKKHKILMSKAHAPKLRYLSTNKKVASVTSRGKITAKSQGSCYIYAYAHNGVCKKIKVNVK